MHKFPPAGFFYIDFELFGLKISLSATVQELVANLRNRRGARATRLRKNADVAN